MPRRISYVETIGDFLGYARASTADQSADLQFDALSDAGAFGRS
jgi:hypothetical protein